MERYCLRTRLLEKPSVCLYYKGMEDGNTAISNALNAIVSFTLEDAQHLDEMAAVRLCKRLNEDRETLLTHGYSEFEITKITSSI